ncbi:hypothetical protein BD408DRAFT_438519 [Parasitella parasitica]|nr:hypothetical protein BD408DRAFT_438519 [Parasitella parasitica]
MHVLARQAANKVADLIEKKDEHLHDMGEEEHSITSSSEDQMECEEVPGKQMKEDNFDGDKDIGMLPAGVKKTGEFGVLYHHSFASSKYASESVTVQMKVDSSAEMMQMTSLNSQTQRSTASLNNAIMQRNGLATTAKSNGVSSVKADGVISVGAGVKESKTDQTTNYNKRECPLFMDSNPQTFKEFLSYLRSKSLQHDIFCLQEVSHFRSQSTLTESQIH